MKQFDSKITNDCGINSNCIDEVFLNRTWTGLIHKENYTGNAFSGNDINFGSSTKSKDNYFMEPYILGVDDSGIYKTPAFGSGIGDRKINSNPQFRWNSLSGGKDLPKWTNGNYVNIPGKVNTPGYWNEPIIFNRELLSQRSNGLKNNTNYKNNKNDKKIIYPENYYSNNNNILLEGFDLKGTENNNATTKCNTKYPNWIILLFLIIIILMTIIIVNV